VVHVKGASSGHLRRMRQNVHFHRGMGRFYRRHYAGQRPWLDVLVYAGIGAMGEAAARARSSRPIALRLSETASLALGLGGLSDVPAVHQAT